MGSSTLDLVSPLGGTAWPGCDPSPQRLRRLDAEHEQRELELARMRRENSEQNARLGNHAIAVSELESLRRQKEAAETYKRRWAARSREYERKAGELIQRAKSQPNFPRCVDMDEDAGLQREVERVPRLHEFCEDLRDRLAYNPQTKQELYYSERDVRAFVAGLAMSRLHLLQGISGTGKTSLHGSSPAPSGAPSRSSRCSRVGATGTICWATSTPSRGAITRAISSWRSTRPRPPRSRIGSV